MRHTGLYAAYRGVFAVEFTEMALDGASQDRITFTDYLHSTETKQWLTLLPEDEVDLDVHVVTGDVDVVEPVAELARTKRRNGARSRLTHSKLQNSFHPRVPVTKLGRLVKDGKIKSMEEIYLFSLPVKEYQVIDLFLPKLKDEVMKIMPVQKQTRAGQRTRFKAFVAIGDFDGHVGLGVKCAKEVATAIRGAIIMAKLSVIPVRRGYWGAALGEPHTVPSKVSGKVGSVMCRLIPAPRGTGIVAAPASKRLLQLAGIQDVYTQSKGSTATMGNFLKATFAAVRPLSKLVLQFIDARADHQNIRLPYTRSLEGHPRIQASLRRVQRSSPAYGEEGLDVLIISVMLYYFRQRFFYRFLRVYLKPESSRPQIH